MNLYWTNSQIPELAGYSKTQREYIQCGAWQMFRKDQPYAYWLVGLPNGIGTSLGIIVANYLLRGFLSPGWYLIMLPVCVMIGASIGYIIGVRIYTERLHPFFRRFIDEHRDEISEFDSPTAFAKRASHGRALPSTGPEW
jgi:hypothetical protein